MSPSNVDFVQSFLEHLRVNSGYLPGDKEYEVLKREIVFSDTAFKLSNFIALFAGEDWARDFLFALPLDLKETTDSAVLYSTDLIATDFSYSGPREWREWKSIESISFKVAAPDDGKLTWKFPFGSSPSLVKTSYQLTHDRAIDISINWPVYSQRSAHGGYRGELQLLQGVRDEHRHYVVGNFSIAAPQYSMTFSNHLYKVDDYLSSIDSVLDLFNVGLSRIEKSKLFNMPQWLQSDLRFQFEKNLPFENLSFVLKKTLSKVFLKEISGSFPFSNIQNSQWWPFNEKASFFFDSLRVVLKDINSPVFRRVVIQLNGKMNIKVPFRLSASLLNEERGYEIAIFPDDDGKMTIQQILEVTNTWTIINIEESFPSVSSLSNSLNITNASLGWRIKEISFMRLGINIEEWTIVPGTFAITNLACIISATFPVKSKQLSLSGSGAIRISDVDLQVIFNIYQHRVAFQLLTMETRLTLKTVFNHFLGRRDILVPNGLDSVLDQTGIESVLFEGLHDSNGWSLSRFAVVTSIETQFNISDKFTLSFPKLIVDVAYPFSESKRTIDAAIGATIDLKETPCDASVRWAEDSKDSTITVTFKPSEDGEAVLLSTLISIFLPDGTTLSAPYSVSFILGIGLANAKLTLSSEKDKFKLREVSATVVSTTRLQLWVGLQLRDLRLYFNYSTQHEATSVKFGASLLFPNGADLDFALTYKGPKTDTYSDTLTGQPDFLTTEENEDWGATVTYKGPISVKDIITGVSNIDLMNLSSIELSALREVMNTSISDLQLALTRNKNETSFTFDANVKYRFFDGQVILKCSKSETWLYSVTFDLSVDGFLSSYQTDNLPKISLTDSTIKLSNKPVTVSPLDDTSSGGLTVTFTGTLSFEKALIGLKKVTSADSLIISGSVSTESFNLAASTPNISFKDMTLSGNLSFSYSLDSKNFEAAIQGKVDNIYLPNISSEKFSTTFSLFVKLPEPELGLEFTLDKLEDVFDVKGLQLKSMLFSAAFQPEDFPIPSSLAIKGAISFHVDNQIFSGSIAIYFQEFNLSHSGTKGTFKTFPSLNQALKGFDSAGKTAPDPVNGTFVDLEFSQALQKVSYKDITIPQGFTLKGSLKLPSIGFDASFDIDIDTSGAHIIGDIKHPIEVTIDDRQLFALTAANDSKRGPSINLSTSSLQKKDCSLSGQIYLLGLSSSADFDLSETSLTYHGTISDFLKISFDIDKTHLDLSASCTLNISIPSFEVATVSIPRLDTVKFAASLTTKVQWGKVSWDLTVTGNTVNLVGWDLVARTFIVHANLSDFTEITSYLEKQFGQNFVDFFDEQVRSILQMKSITDVVDDFKHLGLSAEKVSELLVNGYKCVPGDVIKEVVDVFELDQHAAIKLAKNLGANVGDAARMLKDWFQTGVQDAFKILTDNEYGFDNTLRTLKDEFDLDPHNAAVILKDYGTTLGDITRVLKEVFGLPSKAIAGISNDIGYTIDDIARAFKDVLAITANDISPILKDIGSTGEITRVFERSVQSRS